MKTILLLQLTFFPFALYSAMGSSVQVPVREHMKYTFGNHKNHPIQKQEERRYLASLAPLKEEDIRVNLIQNGYGIDGLRLRDIASELVYEAFVSDKQGARLTLYIDPANGSILHKEDAR